MNIMGNIDATGDEGSEYSNNVVMKHLFRISKQLNKIESMLIYKDVSLPFPEGHGFGSCCQCAHKLSGKDISRVEVQSREYVYIYTECSECGYYGNGSGFNLSEDMKKWFLTNLQEDKIFYQNDSIEKWKW